MGASAKLAGQSHLLLDDRADTRLEAQLPGVPDVRAVWVYSAFPK